jgi:serine/threonine protein kinase
LRWPGARQIIRGSVLGTIIGNYRITALLGEGGMGKVYLAEHPTLARKSAIKVLHADQASDPVALSRFFTEAQAADAIRHPSIVEIFDYGTLPEGAPYIAMEYLDGQTLAQRQADAPLSLGEALDVILQAASALGAAHAKEVLHRDLKPDNLFLVDDPGRPGRPRVKVVDFGIAKLQGDLTGISHRTRTGALLGTPLYMSPEQCLGARDIGPASDLYALAVITYELVCGRPPFEAEAVGAIINMHVNEPVLSPRRLNPGLPRVLEAVLIKALSKAPENRQRSMEELAVELEKVRGLIDRNPALGEVRPEARPSQPLEAPTAVPVSTITGGARVRSTAPASPSRGRAKLGVLAIVAVATALIVLQRRPRVHLVAVPATPAPAVAVAAVVPPPPPAPLSLHLESEPPGATVRLGDRILGVTPVSFATPPTADPIELSFSLEGYRPETVRAVPAAGMRLRATLTPLRRPASKKRPMVQSDDIKSER